MHPQEEGRRHHHLPSELPTQSRRPKQVIFLRALVFVLLFAFLKSLQEVMLHASYFVWPANGTLIFDDEFSGHCS
jgi:hypothetical protein